MPAEATMPHAAAPDDPVMAGEPGRSYLAARLALIVPTWLSAISYGLAPVLPEISREFAGTPGIETVARMLVPALGAAMIVGTPIGAFLAIRYGERPVLIGALGLFALFGTSGMFIHDPWLLLLSRVLTGAAMAVEQLTALTLLTFFVSEGGRNRWIGFYTMSGTIGAVISLPIIGLLGAQNWRLVLLPHLLGLAILVLVALVVPKPPRRSAPVVDEARAERGRISIAMLLLGLACGAIVGTFPVYVPFHLLAVGAAGPERVSLVLLASTLGSGSAALAYGWIRARLGSAELFALAFVLAAAGLSGAVAGASYPAAAVGLLMTGMGAGLLAANLFGTAADAAPERRAARIGVAKTAFFGAPLLAQLPLEPIAAAYGASGALLALGGFAAAVAVLAFAARGILVRA